ncbi:MAG: hypothetical protein Q4B70_18375, partial [Lachnospiraceae bacterium]|nr:hypothetical protein [Lachnospiraceae bacterium]
MTTRKEMKKRAKAVLKRHYIIFVVACLIGMFVGSEFDSSTNFLVKGKNGSTVEVETSGKEEEVTVENGITEGSKGAMDVLEKMIAGDSEGGKQLADEIVEDEVESSKEKENNVLGRSRGILAGLVNTMTSGTIYVKLASGLTSIFHSESAISVLLIFISMIGTVGIWAFLENMYQVVSRRIFLEGRTYERVTMQRFLYLLRIRKWLKVSWTMLVCSVIKTLWYFTIVGGVIKYFSYYMIPYIVAENPDIGP